MTGSGMRELIVVSTLVLLLILVACSHKAPQSTQAVPPPDAPSQQEIDKQEQKVGLPESTRRAIYEELSKAKLNARMIARQRFPGRGSYILVPESPLAKKREGAEQAFLENARQAITAKYGVTSEQLEEIEREGKAKPWVPKLRIDPPRVESRWRIPPEGPI